MSSIVEWVERLQPSTLHVETDEQGRPRVIKLELPATRTAALEREAERTVGEMAEVLSALEAQRDRDLERIEELTAELAAVRARVAGSLAAAQTVARMIRHSLSEIARARYPEPTSLRDCCRWLGERPSEGPRCWWGRLEDDLVATDGRGVLVVRGEGGDAPRFKADGWSDVPEKVVARALDDSRSGWEAYVDAAELVASHPANGEGRRFFVLARRDVRARRVANDVFVDVELVEAFVARAARFTGSTVRVRWSSDPISPVFFSAEEADGCSARAWAAVVMPIRCGDKDAGIYPLRWCAAVRALR